MSACSIALCLLVPGLNPAFLKVPFFLCWNPWEFWHLLRSQRVSAVRVQTVLGSRLVSAVPKVLGIYSFAYTRIKQTTHVPSVTVKITNGSFAKQACMRSLCITSATIPPIVFKIYFKVSFCMELRLCYFNALFGREQAADRQLFPSSSGSMRSCSGVCTKLHICALMLPLQGVMLRWFVEPQSRKLVERSYQKAGAIADPVHSSAALRGSWKARWSKAASRLPSPLPTDEPVEAQVTEQHYSPLQRARATAR